MMEYICNTIEDAKKALNEYTSGRGDIFICTEEVFHYLHNNQYSPDQECNHCLNPDSIMTPETCCTGCSRLQKNTD